MTERSRIGIVGGTFDPPHIGHLLLGLCARASLGLERVHFIPAGEPYHKANRKVTPAARRLAMVQRAIADEPAFVADARDIRRPGATYTVDTLREMRDEGLDGLVFITGSDTISAIPGWKDWQQIEELATLAVAPKGRSPQEITDLARAAGLRRTPEIINMPDVAISSTIIRGRLRAGAPVRYLVTDPVLEYIRAHGLYRDAP